MFEFSQLSGGGNVSGWARHLFLIRFPKQSYPKAHWHMKKYSLGFNGGINVGDGATKFKLQLIM
jgi:hypothetical protein